MNKMIIGLVGYSGSGKSLFTQIVRNNYEIPVISTGDFVRAEVKKRGFELTSKDIFRVSNEIRKENDGVFIKSLMTQINTNLIKSNAVIIDSFRQKVDYVELINQKISDVVIVGISTPDNYRHARLIVRARELSKITLSDFSQLTRFEENLGFSELYSLADYKILNSGSKIAFESLVLNIISQIETEHCFSFKKILRD